MSEIWMPENPIVKASIQEKIKRFGMKLIQGNGVTKGRQLWLRLCDCIGTAVERSFDPGKAAMRSPTKNELNRRIDICWNYALSLDASGYAVVRILPLIGQHLGEQLQIQDEKRHNKDSWIEKETLIASEHEEINDENDPMTDQDGVIIL